MSKLDDVLAKIAALKDEFKATAKEALLELTTGFFRDFPEVKQLTWTQYTPYFNDGEPCIFGVHEVEFVPADAASAAALGIEFDEDVEYAEGDHASVYDLRSGWGATKRYNTDRAQELANELVTVQALTNQIEGALEDIFGDHVRVFINSDGTTETAEHSHD